VTNSFCGYTHNQIHVSWSVSQSEVIPARADRVTVMERVLSTIAYLRKKLAFGQHLRVVLGACPGRAQPVVGFVELSLRPSQTLPMERELERGPLDVVGLIRSLRVACRKQIQPLQARHHNESVH
jgi:hypothetical protein